MVEQQRKDKAADYASDTLANARWLKQAVEQRNQTTLKISAKLSAIRQTFWKKGWIAKAVAAGCGKNGGMHESTVSRVTTGLPVSPAWRDAVEVLLWCEYCNKGLGYEYLCFGSQYGEKDYLSEVPGKPLSDEAISKMISKQGIDLARHTVAKYREC